MSPKNPGRFLSTYDPALAQTICARIAEGETLSAICKGADMPDRGTFRRWVIKDPELRVRYDAARELKATSLFDEALDIARNLTEGENDSTTVRAKQVAIDTLKWAAGKLNPREYGERATGGGVAVIINTTINLGLADRGNGPAPGENLYNLSAVMVTDVTGQEAQTPTGEPAEVHPDRDRRSPRPRRGHSP
jgi:hypothetical protein